MRAGRAIYVPYHQITLLSYKQKTLPRFQHSELNSKFLELSKRATMRPTIIYVLAATLPALSVFAQRHGGGGGGGFFHGGGGGGFPNTFVTVASAAPAAATPPAGSAPAPAPAAAAPPTTGGTTPDPTSGFDASLIPPYGITAGISTNDGTANCVGDNGKAIP